MGLKGHLNAGEIVEQLVHARAVARIRNVVFMVRLWGAGDGERGRCPSGGLMNGRAG